MAPERAERRPGRTTGAGRRSGSRGDSQQGKERSPADQPARRRSGKGQPGKGAPRQDRGTRPAGERGTRPAGDRGTRPAGDRGTRPAGERGTRPAPAVRDAGHGRERGPRLAPPEGITASQLDPQARAELRTLPADLADSVARWLAAAGQEPDPERAYQYALAARRLAARVGLVRETCGIAAYRAGHWAEALSELRTARRLTGRASYLPLIADSERALGRLERALAVVHDPDASRLDRATQIELRIVESGIRRDQGRPAAAVVVLHIPELSDTRRRPWSVSLFYAYADALLEAGREDEAREWFGRAAAMDDGEETDAAIRFESLDPVTIEDLAEGSARPAEDEQDDSEPGA